MTRVLAVAVALATSAVAAHGGGLDRYGCHNDRKRGGYHCHGGGGSSGGGGGGSSTSYSRAAPAPRQAPAAKPAEKKPAALPFGSTKAQVLARYPGAQHLPDGQVSVQGTEADGPLLTCYRFVGDKLSMLSSLVRPDDETPEEAYDTTKEALSEKYGEPQEQDWRAEGRGRASIWVYKTLLISLREYEMKSGPPMVQFTIAPAEVMQGPQGKKLLSLSPVCVPAEAEGSALDL